MPRLFALSRRFLASTRAAIAIEFALVLPMLVLLLLATIDAGRAIAIYMKVRAAAYALDAMTAQYPSVQDDDLQLISGGAAKVLAPYPSGPTGLRISQVEITTAGPKVAWSFALNMTPYVYNTSNNIQVPTKLGGTTTPNNACDPTTYTAGNAPPKGCYLSLAEVQYTYTPLFVQFITGPITLSDSIWMAPRNTLCVQYNNAGCYSPST
ncbi:MAG: pilus assembly protein [Hyphomicrobiales bacterium]|nr:pilus assembly protein [Hyphomicrobiales bacterium]MBV9429217.1 pilus assembly protein [Bradyrhizobiaceae bacterium]